jgi:sulfate adenylyltransferase
VNLSGTKVREMLAKGMELPVEFSRPEVAHILMRYYQSIDAAGRA